MKQILEIFFISIFFLSLPNVTICQVRIPISEFISNDTLLLPRGLIENQIENHTSKLEELNMINSFYHLNGYLIIQFDSNSYIKNFKNGKGTIKLKIFWIDSLSNISDEKYYYYYKTYSTIVDDGYINYLSNTKDDLTTFMYYLYNLNWNNLLKIDHSQTTYLYMWNLLDDETINGQTIWEKIDNPNVKFIIYKTNFYTSIIYNKHLGAKTFIPISKLLSFIPIDNNEMLNDYSKYFRKSKLTAISLNLNFLKK